MERTSSSTVAWRCADATPKARAINVRVGRQKRRAEPSVPCLLHRDLSQGSRTKGVVKVVDGRPVRLWWSPTLQVLTSPITRGSPELSRVRISFAKCGWARVPSLQVFQDWLHLSGTSLECA